MTVNFRTSVPTYNYQRANQQKQKPAFGMVAIPKKELGITGTVFLNKIVEMGKIVLEKEMILGEDYVNIFQKNPTTVEGVNVFDDKVIEGLKTFGCKRMEKRNAIRERELPTEASLKKITDLAEQLFGTYPRNFKKPE